MPSASHSRGIFSAPGQAVTLWIPKLDSLILRVSMYCDGEPFAEAPMTAPTGRPVLFVADPLPQLKLTADSSLALAEEALKRGQRVWWCEPSQLALLGSEIVIQNPIRLHAVDTTGYRAEESKIILPAHEFKGIFIRKDPPFDLDFLDMCWLLAIAKETRTLNPAKKILEFHEKSLQIQAKNEGYLRDSELIPTCLTQDVNLCRTFANDYTRMARDLAQLNGQSARLAFVVKPWRGHGGRGVRKFASASEMEVQLRQEATGGLLPERVLVQPFLPEIHTQGDRRVIMAQGQHICDFVRHPASGRIEANLAQGGRASLSPMSDRQRDTVSRLGAFLKKEGIDFAGVDMIGDWISEVNITSPTGLRTWQGLTGENPATALWEAIGL